MLNKVVGSECKNLRHPSAFRNLDALLGLIGLGLNDCDLRVGGQCSIHPILQRFERTVQNKKRRRQLSELFISEQSSQPETGNLSVVFGFQVFAVSIVSLDLDGHSFDLADHSLLFKFLRFGKFPILVVQHVLLEPFNRER